MNLDNIIKILRVISEEKYPENPEVAEFCEKILKWERDNISFLKPHYKEPYKKYLKAAQRH